MRQFLARCVGLLWALGCSETALPTCQDYFALRTEDGCVGVERAVSCDGRFCVPGEAECATVLHVEAGGSGDGSKDRPFGDLPDAAAAASAGDCVALAEGSYAGAELPGGVSLYSAGAARTLIGAPGLHIEGGAGGVLRGFRLSTGTDVALAVLGSSDLVIEQVLVEAAGAAGFSFEGSRVEVRSVTVRGAEQIGGGVGIWARASDSSPSTVTVSRALVEQNAGEGIVASGGTLTVEDSRVQNNLGYGITVLDSRASSIVRGTIVLGNGRVGILASNAVLAVDGVEVAETRTTAMGDGRLVEANAGADVTLTDSVLRDSDHLGVLVDASRLRAEGGEVSGSRRAFWIQNTTADPSVTIVGVDVHGNEFVGVGALKAVGVEVRGGRLAGTTLASVVSGPSTITAADGLQALVGSDVEILEDTVVEANERAGVLLDASTGTVATTVTVTAGGSAQSIVVQEGAEPLEEDGSDMDPRRYYVPPEAFPVAETEFPQAE